MKLSAHTERNIRYRKPVSKDGTAVWQLIKESGTLDLNSPYCYIMLCDMFRDTCAVAQKGSKLGGFMSAYRRPDAPETLFVWQAAVSLTARGQGVAKSMLREILEREENKHIRYVEATISPDNTASQRLFLSLAEECGCTFSITEKYGMSLFPEGMNHDRELLYRIGPIRKSTGIRVVN